jgi:hypothetical protein
MRNALAPFPAFLTYIMDHVEDAYLKLLPIDEKVSCYHPICKSRGVVLNNVNHFKNQAARVHNITLREPRYVG